MVIMRGKSLCLISGESYRKSAYMPPELKTAETYGEGFKRYAEFLAATDFELLRL